MTRQGERTSEIGAGERPRSTIANGRLFGAPCLIAACLIAVLSGGLAPLTAFAQPQRQPSRPQPEAAAPAPLPDSPDAYRIATDQWIARHKPATFVVAIKRGGRIVYSRAEKTSIEQPTLLASLSKMITGICVATLVRDGKLDFDTPMRDALSGFFARHGAPSDARFLDVTVEQLLTHRSGLMGNPDGDVVHKIIARLARAGKGATASIQAILADHLKHPLKRAPGASYAYSNAGYIALGAVIEDRSKRPYEDYCRDAVMKPLNVASAKLHPDWRIHSSMGGWIVAPVDYLALADVISPDNSFLGDKTKVWIDAVRANGAMGADGWYSLGVITHAGSGRWSISHGGQLNSRGVDAKGRAITAIIRSTFARAPDGTSLFAAFTPANYDNKALNDLRAALGRATQAWKSFR